MSTVQSNLEKLGTFDFETGSVEEYTALLKQVDTEVKELKQSYTAYMTAAQESIDKQQEEVNIARTKVDSIKSTISANKQEIASLSEGEAAYNKINSSAKKFTEEQFEQAVAYE